MFHQEYKGDIPYTQPEEPVDGHQDTAHAPRFQDYQNAPRTGLNQTAVQDYVGINDRKKQNAETANENSNDYYSSEEINKTTFEEAKTMNKSDQKDPAQSDNNQSRVDIPGNNFQRPGIPQAAASRPAYPGTYAGGASQAANAPGYTANTPAHDPESNKLVIGAGINLSGEIEACDHLIVQGTVEASLKGANILDITEQGAFFGTVEIENANIAGRFEGDITVRGRLSLESTGIIVGTIAYKELAIEAGATIDGAISPIGSENAAANRKPMSAPKAKKVMKSNDAELPFSDKKVAAE